jgi:hypothetical protein
MKKAIFDQQQELSGTWCEVLSITPPILIAAGTVRCGLGADFGVLRQHSAQLSARSVHQRPQSTKSNSDDNAKTNCVGYCNGKAN